jgi:hypothetical protein
MPGIASAMTAAAGAEHWLRKLREIIQNKTTATHKLARK